MNKTKHTHTQKRRKGFWGGGGEMGKDLSREKEIQKVTC